MAQETESLAEKITRHVAELKMVRTSLEPHWADVASFLLPYRHRTTLSQENRGDRRNHEILDATATLSYRVYRAGMMAGNTSPARSWFRLLPEDPDLAEFPSVRRWLDEVRKRMETWFARSNLYNSLPILYGDAGGFGIGAISVEEDPETLLMTRTYPVGSWWIGRDWKGRVVVWYREMRLSVRQLVERFGLKNVSRTVRDLYDRCAYETLIDVGHYISPNEDYDAESLDASRSSVYRSVYFEIGGAGTGLGVGVHGPFGQPRGIASGVQHILSDRGFDYFPLLVFTWERSGEDTYGIDCPGMTAIGDIKQLQKGERKALQAIDKMVDPPLVAPPWVKKEGDVATLPGKITYVTEREGIQGIRPLYQLQFDIGALEAKQEQVRGRIREAFYVDLFRMFATLEHEPGSRTATEILERKEEKLVQLGPVIEALNSEVLNPLIDLAFTFMVRQGKLPPPPDELEGQPLKVEYVSLMAQAQRTVGLAAIERTVAFVGQIAAGGMPEVADKIDWDQAIDEYAERVGAPPRMIRGDDETAAIRAARAQAQAARAQLEALEQSSKVAKNLAQADTSGRNALTDITGALAPVLEEVSAQ